MPPTARSSSPAEVQVLEVDEEHAGQRLDNFLIKKIKGVPKSRLYRLVRKGEIRINKGRRRVNYRLHTGDKVRIPPIRSSVRTPKRVKPADLQWLLACVIYQDDGLIAINKPSGLAVHGGSGISLGLIEGLRQLYPKTRFLELVHRLDRDTSGCILVAKKRAMLVALQAQLQQGQIDKRYLALVRGEWGKARTIKAPLERISRPNGERWVQVSESGKAARSRILSLKQYPLATRVEIQLLTGRTHQARVHTAHEGHPIAGDPKYGDREFNAEMKKLGLQRLFLHARSLSFRHPQEHRQMKIEAPLSSDLEQVLEKLEHAQ